MEIAGSTGSGVLEKSGVDVSSDGGGAVVVAWGGMTGVNVVGLVPRPNAGLSFVMSVAT